ncbi:starvation-inducible outer membrane lipoprotein [Idiomarina xiamenensis 10-D-4]|uniref:Starvation-inducible outer membrane lipoprotein n=2 Tax=Idiomarina xiamenensis TaxID=1207041 RepID=K2KJQ5_9GAMM|nr:starvation-inducible outer membrane lipoprotein [Idiomarina xiamenensis 10-D-4]
MKVLWSIAALLVLSGCSSIPDPIKANDGETLVSYTQALENPQQTVGQRARWGGVIAAVNNSEQGTVIEVVNFDLQSWGRPLASDQSNGRFRAVIDGFVDPMVYKKGRSITVIGTIAEPQQGKIDEYRYLYPVIDVSGKYLWKEIKETRVEVDYSPLWFRHQFYAPPYYYYPRTRVVPARTQKSSGNKQ